MSEKFKHPPVLQNIHGDIRRVGYEFEFTGIDMARVAAIVKELYGGDVQKITTFEYEVNDTKFGTFTLELDAQLLREKKYEKLLGAVGVDLPRFKDKEKIEDSLLGVASTVVPFEIVTPPIPVPEMYRLNSLVSHLRNEKARGTGSSFIYAFGLHLNPEIPSERTESLLNHLRAYVMLDPWIREAADIDISRRITPYINPYEDEYIRLILNPDYQPDLKQLITDYFSYKNSRNRPLDMLPLFMHLEEEFTVSLIEEGLTSSRPTFHYRLPNCSLEDENWTLAAEWNRWVLVEELASDKSALNQYSRAWLKMEKETLIGFKRKWIELMNRRIEENA
ncbi:MAG: amidoligase family protein [Balneolaceae bacterium]|nr:amidoligase family protein [Balneolaceae bacterium]